MTISPKHIGIMLLTSFVLMTLSTSAFAKCGPQTRIKTIWPSQSTPLLQDNVFVITDRNHYSSPLNKLDSADVQLWVLGKKNKRIKKIGVTVQSVSSQRQWASAIIKPTSNLPKGQKVQLVVGGTFKKTQTWTVGQTPSKKALAINWGKLPSSVQFSTRRLGCGNAQTLKFSTSVTSNMPFLLLIKPKRRVKTNTSKQPKFVDQYITQPPNFSPGQLNLSTSMCSHGMIVEKGDVLEIVAMDQRGHMVKAPNTITLK